ncbi:MAG TPA: SDR family NAD(P)-dependent oxidoreductase, partial [Candidatus Acidoferrum sp.]|nr:SDR family NAD(P)-dependent oxidoreductase [Candidatus Acidoferrum sp.]
MEKRNLTLKSPGSGAKDFRLDGKVAIVTGGGSGIGQAIALRFAANGATVRIADINLQQAVATAKQISEAGGQGTAHACDVTNQQQVREVFNGLFAKERVEILVNNAGISHVGTVESTTEE